ncbi:leukocyte elastase inhibitor-like isoform X2 [Lycorma delicatula]|uniref:leukocyte elastase inhibitor-like isoform X2 n=1 Tax=Lycorma delicatula TaxID=130591 RepID=UPI003F5143C6
MSKLKKEIDAVPTATQNLSSEQASILAELSHVSNSFATKFYKILSKANPDRNVIACPLSLQVALSLTYSGAVGVTADEIASALQIPNDMNRFYEGYKLLVNELESPNLDIATRIFAEKTFGVKENYKKNAHTYFNADAETVDFMQDSQEARTCINDWVAKKTNDKIKDLITEGFITKDTVMLLINAVYFKADWSFRFCDEDTRTEKFYINENDTVDVDMMHLNKKDMHFAKHPILKAKILQLPYKDHDFSMFIILPDEITGLSQTEEALNTVNLAEELKNLRQREVHISLPKFELAQTLDLQVVLESFGIKTMFSRYANFSGISDLPLSVSKVVQKAFISVDEEGTVAAAATVLKLSLRKVIYPEEFKADHPFLFVITKKANDEITIVFIGKYCKK